MAPPRKLPFPDGLVDRHAGPDRGLRRHASPLSAIVLLILLGAAMTGRLGGAPSPVMTVQAPAATMTLDMPRILRSGLFFESRYAVTTHRAFSDLTLRIPARLWQDMTINSLYPDPESQDYKDGDILLSYGPFDAGERLEIKIDGQVNPPLIGPLEGTVVLADGDTPVAQLPLSLKVLP